jgi:TolA-binding protein
MRSETVRQTKRSCTIAAAVLLLAVAVAYSQQQTRPAPRIRDRQQGQMMSSQMGQPDFAQQMAERNARRMQEMQEEMEQMQRQAQESRNRSIQQALRATDEQWRRLKPQLDRIERLRTEANVAADLGSGGPGGFQGQMFTFGSGDAGGFGGGGMMMGGGSPDGQTTNWSRTWSVGSKSRMEMTEGEILCEEIQHLLQGASVPGAEIAQKVTALRKIRAQARDDLAKARMGLRKLMLPHQEPALIVMGYLD